jgi:hypothetical protein
MPDRSGKFGDGDIVGARRFETISGEQVGIPDSSGLVHLQFRRFAGCPVCNLHLHSMMRRQDEIAAAGIREIVFFHSTAEDLREHAAMFPFAVIADPDKKVYAAFGVESGARALLDPRGWGAIAGGIARSMSAVIAGRESAPSLNPHGGRYGLPADLLIAPDGRVIASKYGEYVDDQWSVDELLDLAQMA